MTDRNSERNGADAALELLRLAGPRLEPPEATANRVRGAVRNHWQDRARSNRKRKWLLLAASLLGATVLASLWMAQVGGFVGEGSMLATVDVIRGEVRWMAGGDRLALSPSARVGRGTTVETGADGRVAARLADGRSLRIDNSSRLSFVSKNRVQLDRGAVYVDSGGRASDGGLLVVTSLAEIREIGTQFEVRLFDGEMRARVREGSIEAARAGQVHQVAAGTEIVIGRDGVVDLHTVSPTDHEWGWVLDVAPSFSLEGSSAGDLLRWVCRETGHGLQWASPELARNAERIELHGDVSAARPDQVLDLVLPTCGLEHQMENGSVVVRVATH